MPGHGEVLLDALGVFAQQARQQLAGREVLLDVHRDGREVDQPAAHLGLEAHDPLEEPLDAVRLVVGLVGELEEDGIEEERHLLGDVPERYQRPVDPASPGHARPEEQRRRGVALGVEELREFRLQPGNVLGFRDAVDRRPCRGRCCGGRCTGRGGRREEQP